MVALQHNIFLEQQPSIATDLLTSMSNHISEFIQKIYLDSKMKMIEKDVLHITRNAHEYNAKIEAIRDFVDLYYINNIETDEYILSKFSEKIEELVPDIECVLDSEVVKSFPDPIKNAILSAYDELYSTLINTNFVIYQKIAQAYLDGKSTTELLQEA